MPIGRCCSASRASKIKVATHHREMSSTITWHKIRPLKLSRVAGCGGLELSLFPRSRFVRTVLALTGILRRGMEVHEEVHLRLMWLASTMRKRTKYLRFFRALI